MATGGKMKAVEIRMWYDRRIRLWTLYPIDGEGNQIAEATYGANKAEALSIKRELENEYGIVIDEEISVKRLREMTGLSAQKFGDKYKIPLRTIQNWEYGINPTPEYVLLLLERAVREDFNIS